MGQDDPPPEFYDFTAEDYHRVMAGHGSASTSREMRTGAMRKADMEAAALQLGPVPLRVYFPEDVVVQVCFAIMHVSYLPWAPSR